MSEIKPVAWMHPMIKAVMHVDEKAAIFAYQDEGPKFAAAARSADKYTVPLYDVSALAAKDAELADMRKTIREQQDEIKALREREEKHDAVIAALKFRLEVAVHPYDGIATRDETIRMQDAAIARLRDLVKRLADALDMTLTTISEMPPYEVEAALVAEARKEIAP